jgi:hypothetical protein
VDGKAGVQAGRQKTMHSRELKGRQAATEGSAGEGKQPRRAVEVKSGSWKAWRQTGKGVEGREAGRQEPRSQGIDGSHAGSQQDIGR